MTTHNIGFYSQILIFFFRILKSRYSLLSVALTDMNKAHFTRQRLIYISHTTLMGVRAGSRLYTTQNLLRITFSFNDLMLKTNRLKKDFFYKDRLIFGLDDPVANMSIWHVLCMRSSGKDIPLKTCFILPCIFKCVGTFSELSTKLSLILD